MKLPDLQYSSPVAYSRKQRAQLAVIPPIVVNLLKGILHTCRHEVRGEQYLRQTREPRGRAIVGIWHETATYALYLHRGSNFHSASSFSFDGELAARLTAGFDIECLRGSTSRGGAGLLRQLEKALELVECVGLTMDGPRGPRRQAQPGLAILSARTGVPVVPLAAAVSRSWRLRTWDRMAVPRPFSRVIHAYAPPIPPAESMDREVIEDRRQRIQDALNELHEKIEAELGDPQPGFSGTVES